MSYWVTLAYADSPAKVGSHQEGGTYVAFRKTELLHGQYITVGSDNAELNVTYNYSPNICAALHQEGLRWLSGKVARDCIGALAIAVRQLGTECDNDYWEPTKGNAGYALSILLNWAKQHPTAVFHVD